MDEAKWELLQALMCLILPLIVLGIFVAWLFAYVLARILGREPPAGRFARFFAILPPSLAGLLGFRPPRDVPPPLPPTQMVLKVDHRETISPTIPIPTPMLIPSSEESILVRETIILPLQNEELKQEVFDNVYLYFSEKPKLIEISLENEELKNQAIADVYELSRQGPILVRERISPSISTTPTPTPAYPPEKPILVRETFFLPLLDEEFKQEVFDDVYKYFPQEPIQVEIVLQDEEFRYKTIPDIYKSLPSPEKPILVREIIYLSPQSEEVRQKVIADICEEYFPPEERDEEVVEILSNFVDEVVKAAICGIIGQAAWKMVEKGYLSARNKLKGRGRNKAAECFEQWGKDGIALRNFFRRTPKARIAEIEHSTGIDRENLRCYLKLLQIAGAVKHYPSCFYGLVE